MGQQGLHTISNGDVFERVAPCASKGYPQLGDRYAVNNPWNTVTGLIAVERTIGQWSRTEVVDCLLDPRKWKRIDMAATPSILEVLTEELAGLIR